jgi:hypothetical protein
MEAHETLQAMLSVGKKYSIDVNDLRLLPLKIITLSVKFISREALWTNRFEQAYVHWELVKQLTMTKNVLGGVREWLGMLTFCRWDELSKAEGDISNAHTPLNTTRRNMRECNLDTGDTDAWTLACKVFLLTLVQGIPCLHALEMLTCAQFKRNTRTGCVEFMAKQVMVRMMHVRARANVMATTAGGALVHARPVRDHAPLYPGAMQGGRDEAGADAGNDPSGRRGEEAEPVAVAHDGDPRQAEAARPGGDGSEDGRAQGAGEATRWRLAHVCSHGVCGVGGHAAGHVGVVHGVLLQAPIPTDAQ